MVRRALFWSFFSQIANFGVQFGTSVVTARLLTPVQTGVYGIAWSVIGIVALFTSFSVGTYVIREKELSDHVVDTAYTINLVMSFALSALIFACSLYAGDFLGNKDVDGVLRILSIGPILGVFAFRPSIMLQRAMQFRGVSVLSTVTMVIGSAVTIASAFSGKGSYSPAYGNLASGAVGAIGAIIIGKHHNSFRLSTRDWRPIAAFGLRLMSIGGISTTAARVSDVILGRLLGLEALGLYNRAGNLGGLLFNNVYGAATKVVFAQLSEAQRDQGRVTQIFERGFRLITAIMGPLNLSLAVLAGPTIYRLYGEKWSAAALPFALLMIAQLITLTFAMNWELFVVRDKLATQTKLEFIRSLTSVVTQVIGSCFSIVAVAASAIFDALVSVFIYEKHMVALTDLPRSRLHKRYAEALALSVAAAVPSFALMVTERWDAHVSYPLLLLAILSGICLWFSCALVIRHPLIAEVKIIARKVPYLSRVLGA